MLVPSVVCAPAGRHQQYLTTYLVNASLAIDAGSLGLYMGPREQRRIRHVLLSHSHIDHLASLPIFLENVKSGRSDPVTIHGNAAVLDSLRRDIFNDRIWPDLIRLAAEAGPFAELAADQPVELEGVRITPVAVNHVVPTFGFMLEQDRAAVVIATDTGPTDAIWQRAAQLPNLCGVFLEVTFPNRLESLALAAKHLTPAMFGRELAKLGRPVRTIVMHVKVGFQEEVLAEIEALGLPQVEVIQPGKVYEF
jgi:ribonuclease BN (tRNA processing enzyme)